MHISPACCVPEPGSAATYCSGIVSVGICATRPARRWIIKIAVFGATGGTGSQFLRKALQDGHDVVAVVREGSRLEVPGHRTVRTVVAEVTVPDSIVQAIDGVDAVVSALGPRKGGSPTICADGSAAVTTAMDITRVRRLVMVSAGGMVIDAGDSPMMRYVMKPLLGRMLRTSFADMRRAEEIVRGSALDWTIVRPPRLTDGPPKGTYRTAVDRNVRGGGRIGRADLAACMLRLVGDASAIDRHIAVAW